MAYDYATFYCTLPHLDPKSTTADKAVTRSLLPVSPPDSRGDVALYIQIRQSDRVDVDSDKHRFRDGKANGLSRMGLEASGFGVPDLHILSQRYMILYYESFSFPLLPRNINSVF